MKTITCIIVDDEPQARRILNSYVSLLSNWTIVQECTNAVEAFEALRKYNIDVIFLDIQMPVISGNDFLRSLRNPPLVIFTTAYNRYATEGYDLDITDYLLKPISHSRFLQSVGKAELRLGLKENNWNQSVENFIFVKSGSKLVKIDFNKILYIEAMQNYVKIITSEAVIVTVMTMKMIEEILKNHDFCRIHKSYIISLDKITAVEGNIVRISNNTLPVGSVYKESFLKKLKIK